MYTFGPALPTQYYLIGGAGVYNTHAKAQVSDVRASSTKFGLNVGVGVKTQVAGFAIFFEARYQNVIHGSDMGVPGDSSIKLKSMQFVPISVGIAF